ncbi:hypothetical protein SAMN02745164_01323 [Marinitoga hydrogenitolerans DSM 16785]|uniref:Phospholipase C/D domain-containing protein n=1 Tax=Marinitoga hydrogenitolerans (strain DSM 16785 / JCM 12826 / AT1271) TaxID=1122195 RepID=A0A1M4X2A3_MARH1|nr:zinc dependent phospholipase C family protein [Marinitoga hydrogenitolerans]SHE87487.1 hypothetical protein SAMN02745164_01323 [Marinitoga hydrogenitolerans DSM 16785]
MPSILAHIIYTIKNPVEYLGPELYLGAQGPDVFFYANETDYISVGTALHKLKSTEYKELMKNFPKSFYYGYISHMKLDEKLHPLINSYYSEPIQHTKFEYNFDELLSLKLFGIHFIEHKWWKILEVKNIEKISKEFDKMLKKEFKIRNVSYEYAYKKMLKNLRILFELPYFKKNILAKILKYIGKDYTYLFPNIEDNDINKLSHIEKEFFSILKISGRESNQ